MWRLSFPLVAHRKTKRLWPPPFDELSLSFAPTAPLPLSGPCGSSPCPSTHSHCLPLNTSRSPPVDQFQLTCSVSQPTLTAQPFPCDSFRAESPQGFAQPSPPVPTYIHSTFITSLSTSHQLSTPRCRAMLMAIQVLLRCMLLQCMYLCHLMHI